MARGRQAVVTGATRGIGRAIARRLARDGFTLVLNYAHDDVRAAEAQAEVSQYSPDSILVRADVTDEDEVERLVSAAAARGRIDLWVNSVGDFLFKPVVDTSPAEWQAILASNLTSAFLCTRAVIPRLRAQAEGEIIYVAAMHAEVLRAVPNTVPYAIAKTGLLILMKSLAKSEGPYGIRVNAVCPGLIEGGEHTGPRATDTIPLRRLGQADDVAAAVSFLASDEARYITGAVLNVHGGAFL